MENALTRHRPTTTASRLDALLIESSGGTELRSVYLDHDPVPEGNYLRERLVDERLNIE